MNENQNTKTTKNERPCSECIWHTEDGCLVWDCDPVTRREAKRILKAAKLAEVEP